MENENAQVIDILSRVRYTVLRTKKGITMYGFYYNSFFDGVFPILFSGVFIFVLGMFAFVIFSGIREWNRNNHSPRLTVDALVVAKRTDISSHQHANAGDATGTHGFHTTTSTSYYVTFQVESGDRMEFLVNSTEYGILVEGDRGRLSFQGSRYLGFERQVC